MAATHLRSLLFASFALITCSAIGQNSDLTILGTLGGPSSVAYDVAADSWVVGAADTAGGNGAFVALPTGGTLFNMLALPKPSGWISGEARGINQFHQIAGWIFSPSAGRAMPWVWAGTSLGAQLPLPPGALGGGVYAINDLGQAVGWREHGSLSIIQRPCFWDPVLGPTVIGTYQGEALAINNRGVVAGWTYDDNGYQVGFVWDLLLGIRLLPKAPTWTQFKATGINDQGVVVGTAQVGANTRAIKWPGDGTYVDLGTLGGLSSSARAITERGTILGNSRNASNALRATYFNGSWQDIDPACYVTNGATAVHDPSLFVGGATIGGFDRAFIFRRLISDPNGVGIGSVSCPRSLLIAGEVIDATTQLVSGGPSVSHGDTIIHLTSSNPAAASVPAYTIMRDRHGSARFRITVGNVASSTNVTITAIYPAGYRQPEAPIELQVNPAGARSVQGHVTLGDYGAAPSTEVTAFRVYSLPGEALVAERSALLDASGNFQFTLPNQGTYSVVAQGRHWLGKKLTPVTVGAAGASGLNFILVNGDIDGDNEVGIGDYSQLSEAYLSTYLAPTWNEDADLNGDEEVDIGDYSVLAANYGILGD